MPWPIAVLSDAMTDNFSSRFGHRSQEREITIREGAPEGLRGYVIQLMYEIGFKPSELRTIVCRVLKQAPDVQGNWSEFPNIDYEVNQLLAECDWFLVYDVIETFFSKVTSDKKKKFEDEINDYFRINGIGWKLENGRIETRGDIAFENSLNKAVGVLQDSGLKTATTELQEAIHDLSRRPTPDITGAIQHSLASFECLTRELVGNNKMTLGELIKKFPGAIPPPLDVAIEKIWGYSSEQGRHLREGQEPTYEEAELIVHTVSSLTNYLGKKLKKGERATPKPW